MTMDTQTVLVTVARNRSLCVPVIAGHRHDGEELVPVFQLRAIGPGETVEVCVDEVALLIERGFILDPNAAPPAPILVQDGTAPLDGRIQGMGVG